MRKYLLAALMGLLIGQFAFGAGSDVKSTIGKEDINLTQTDGGAPETFTRRTSTGGTINVEKLEGNDIPWSNAYTRTIRPKNVTGDNTGRLSGFSIGSASYTDNGYFGDVIARGPWVDVRAGFGGTFDNVADDKAAIQAAVTAGESLGVPWTLYVPHGVNARIKNPIRFAKGNVTITGGGSIFVDTASFTDNLAMPGYSSNVRAGFIFWDGSATTHYIDSYTPYDHAYDNSLLSNITIDGITMYDKFGVTGTYTTLSYAIMFGWCNNVTVTHCRFEGFHAEILLGFLTNSRITNNYFYNSSNQAISLFDENVTYSYNTFYKVGNAYEGSLHHGKFSNNVLDNVGTTTSPAFQIYNSSVGWGIFGEVSNNIITNLQSAPSAIYSIMTTSNHLYDLKVINNTIMGKLATDGNFVNITSPSADNGSLIISGNTIIEDGAQAVNWNSAIAVGGALAGTKSSTTITGNNTVHRTAYAFTSIDIGGLARGIVSGNSIATTSDLRLNSESYFKFDGVILATTSSAVTSLSNDNIVIGENYHNHSIIRDDLLSVASWSDNVLNTRGRRTIRLTNTGTATIDRIAANPGDIITLITAGDNVVVDNTAYIQTHDGSNVTLTVGKIYQFIVYTINSSNLYQYLKALGAPVTI